MFFRHAAQQSLQRVHIRLKHHSFCDAKQMGLIRDPAVRWRTCCNLQATTFSHRWQSVEMHELALHDNSMLCTCVR